MINKVLCLRPFSESFSCLLCSATTAARFTAEFYGKCNILGMQWTNAPRMCTSSLFFFTSICCRRVSLLLSRCKGVMQILRGSARIVQSFGATKIVEITFSNAFLPPLSEPLTTKRGCVKEFRGFWSKLSMQVLYTTSNFQVDGFSNSIFLRNSIA